MTGRHLALFTLLTVAACLAAAWSPADEPAKAERPTADSMLGDEAGDVRDDNGLKMKLVWCPPGVFEMESTQMEERKGIVLLRPSNPVKVVLTRGYWLGKYEVTQSEWMSVMGTEPWKGYRNVQEGMAVAATHVTWKESMEFCRKLTEQEQGAERLRDGWRFTLPTEAQWERACRARTQTAFSFGDDAARFGEYGWSYENVRNGDNQFARDVGRKKPNPWGLHDMHGNAREWCSDSYSEMRTGGRDPEYEDDSRDHVCRGGGWTDLADECRSASRSRGPSWSAALGFRVALSPVQPAK